MPKALLININGEYKDVKLDDVKSIEDHFDTKGETLIRLEEYKCYTGVYQIYGYVVGNVPFNKYEFLTCNPRGCAMILRINDKGVLDDVYKDDFELLYNKTDELDDYLIEDELYSQDDYDYDDDFIVRDYPDNEERFNDMINNPFGHW